MDEYSSQVHIFATEYQHLVMTSTYANLSQYFKLFFALLKTITKLYKRNNTFYNQKNNSLHFNLNDSIDRRSQSRGILSLIEWSRLTREFIPTLVLLLLLVLKVV